MDKVYYVSPKEQKTEVSLMDLLLGREYDDNSIPNTTSVKLRSQSWKPGKDYTTAQIVRFVQELKEFNEFTDKFREMDRWNDLYRHFKLPKKSGGLRPIDAPVKELENALTMLGLIIKRNIGDYFHHPCAFAYVKQRCPRKLVEVHQKAESRWFLHLDFSNFFGSTTLEFTLRMCEKIYPLNRVMENPHGREELTKALELCFLNGGLPQGTTMSPFLTNILMIPIDHEILKFCGNNKPHLIYTRYADDLWISSKYDFDYRAVEKRINEILREFNAPFLLKPEKTHYGSNAGRNWILGVMLNKDNKITIGHEVKKRFKAMLCNYIIGIKKGIFWDLDDVYEFQGKMSYYRSIEPDYINYVIQQYNNKFGVDVEALIKKQIKGEPIAA